MTHKHTKFKHHSPPFIKPHIKIKHIINPTRFIKNPLRFPTCVDLQGEILCYGNKTDEKKLRMR